LRVPVESETYPRAEEALRLLAAAAGSARLYPSSSPLPAEAAAKFTRRSNEVTSSQGPLRYAVGPDGFKIGDADIAAGSNQVASLAKALHALQVGQVVIAPGLTDAETAAFVTIANAEPSAVRAVGGPRVVLGSAKVAHIAVVEVSLRASEEKGLLGLDLLTAPIDDVARELAAAAEAWGEAMGPGEDQMAGALGRLEEATRGLALERVVSAIMRLDEPTRLRVLSLALKSDANGRRMDGMLEAIAQMKPAALARMLTLVATQAQTDPNRLAAALPLAPETASRVKPLLAPIRADAEIAHAPHASELASIMAREDDSSDLQRQLSVASPQLTAGRALATAVAVSRSHADPEAIRAIGDTLPSAAKDGAFPTVREALRRLDELASRAELTVDIADARATLYDAAVLAEVCRAVETDSDAAIAGEILQMAGPCGAEALLETYLRGNDYHRSLLRPALRSMSEAILGVARSRLRTEEPRRAVDVLKTLSALGDRRAIPLMSEALANLDEQVRFAAITALADTPEPEAANALIRALRHSEPETQRFAVREIGRVRAAPAVFQLTRALDDLNVLQRTHETKKAVIHALAQIGTADAQRALKRTAERRFAWTRKSKELRALARRALEESARIQVESQTEGAQ
jgi:HEAT repeat protein